MECVGRGEADAGIKRRGFLGVEKEIRGKLHGNMIHGNARGGGGGTDRDKGRRHQRRMEVREAMINAGRGCGEGRG